MDKTGKLSIVKAVHTLIWIFYNCVIFYMLYAAVFNKIDGLFWGCLGMVLLEGMLLLIFKFTCPLTLVARRYTNDQKDNFDIYLPEWLARNTKRIYTAITVFIILISAFQLLRSWA
jgi:hypothetical protein